MAPLGPISPMISPRSSVRSTPSTARTPSNHTRTLSVRSFAGPEPSTLASISLPTSLPDYPPVGWGPMQGLPSPMSGIDSTAIVSICLSTPFVNCSTENAAGWGRWQTGVNFILFPK